jgi:biliverdin reductase
MSAMNCIGIGLVGTGYAAKVRAEVINAESRATLIGVSGNTPEKLAAFVETHQTQAFADWQALVNSPDVNLVVISNLNSAHGAIVRAALFAKKHVVVEYPLTLSVSEAESLSALAKNQNCLLHVEHIELMGGMHQSLIEYLPKIGQPFYARYATIVPQHPAPKKWTFNHEMFGFPLMGALSRLHRFTHLFGEVASVSCRATYQASNEALYYSTCQCSGQFLFKNGLLLDVIYGKGESVWVPERKLEIQGSTGALVFDGDDGKLINAGGTHNLEVLGRKGLFARDMAAVLDHLFDQVPLYVTLQQSLYTMKVAEAAQRSAELGKTIDLEAV